MSENGKHNHPMPKRANYGGAGGEARPDEKMGHRHADEWPYFNTDGTFRVTHGMRRLLKRVAAKKRRQRDRQEGIG